MKILIPLTVATTLFLTGCNFGEYADDNSSTTSDSVSSTTTASGETTYKFTQSSFENKTYYKTYISNDDDDDENWTIIEYDFNATTFSANLVRGLGESSSSGTYEIDEDNNGALVLTFMGDLNWVRPTKYDDDKIWLLWTDSVSDINGTTPNTDLFFFTDYDTALEYVEDREDEDNE